MKKLITLLLVLTGCVGTMSADELNSATIYVKADFIPKIYIYGTEGGTSHEWGNSPSMESTTLNGITVYKYDVSYKNTYSFIIRNAEGTTQSEDQTGNDGDRYCEWDGTDKNSEHNNPTYKKMNFVVAGSRALTNNYEDWNGTSSNNKMTSTDDETFTITITDRPLKAGVTYKYKVVGYGGDGQESGWYPGSDKEITVAADGLYDITFTYTRDGNAVSNTTPSLKQSGTISYKYYVYDNDAGYWDGITAFTGKNWTACEMTNVNGTYVYGISGKTLTSGTRYGSRFIEEHYIDDTKVGTAWIYVGTGGSQGCRYYDCTSTGTYNIVLSYTPDQYYNIDANQPKLSVTTGLYAAESSSWSTGHEMEFDATNGVYKYSFDNINGNSFALSTNSDITTNSWSYAIRPEYGESVGTYDVNAFNVFSGTGVTTGQKTWILNASGVDNVEITFRPTDYHWEVTPYITGSVSTAGYATYSHGSAYKITGEGVGVYTITATAAGEATMSSDWNDAALPAGTGVVLQGSTSSATPYTVTPSDGSASIGTNLLVGSGDSEATITAEDGFEKYILANKTNGVKFYKWDGSSENNHNKLSAHKAYLRVPTDPGAPEFFNFNFDFGGETTDVSEKVIVKSEKFLSEESVARNATAPVFNLKGQRVMNPTKGLYIINGKKVVLK